MGTDKLIADSTAGVGQEMRLAFTSAGLLLWEWIVGQEEILWGSGVESVYGLPAEQLNLETWKQRLHPEDRERVLGSIAQSLETKASFEEEFRVIWSDGSEHWVLSKAEFGAAAGGEPERLFGINLEVTSRKKTEIELRTGQERLQAALTASRTGTFRWDIRTNQLEWDLELDRLFGLPAGQTIRSLEAFIARVHQDDRSAVVTRCIDCAELGSNFEMEFRVVWPDGTIRWLYDRGKTYRDSAGCPSYMTGACVDITGRKQSEQALRESETHLSLVMEAADLGSWDWDVQSGALTWSPRCLTIFGLDPKTVMTYEKFLLSVHPDDRERTDLAVKTAIENRDEYNIELRTAGFDGQSRWVNSRGRAYYDADGKPVRMSGAVLDISERKYAEAALQNSENLARVQANELAAILEAVPALTFIAHDPECATVTGNRAVYDLLGLPLGTNLSEARATPEHPGLFRMLKGGRLLNESEMPLQSAVTAGEPIRDYDFQIQVNDQPPRDCFGHSVPLLDPSGIGRGAVGAFVDITELKKANQKLLESNARFQTMFESDLIGILISAKDGACLDGNDAFLRIIGYSREELNSGLIRWNKITPDEYLPLDDNGISEVALYGSCTPYEKEYIRRDGSRVPVLIGYTQLESGLDRYIAFILDLTAQKKAEAVMRSREEQFRVLADSLPQLISIYDASGNPEYCNQEFLRYTGLGMEEFLLLSIDAVRERLLHPDDLAFTRSKWGGPLGAGETYQNESRIRRADGAYRIFLTRAVPVRNEEGSIVRWIGSSTDIHDQKLAEEAMRRSEKLAATGRLASSIAHEINNPLMAVTSLLYLLGQEEGLTENARKILKTAEEEADRMGHIVTQTLRFGRSTREPIKADLPEVAESVLTLFKARLTQAGVRLERDYRMPSALICRADEIRQVLANLISNAHDAMRSGGRLRLKIRNSRSWDGSSSFGLRITVADTGCGIPKEVLHRIYEPFVTTKEATGTGLGLWVTSEIIRRHDGRIFVRSSTKPGQSGTVFSIYLPFRDESKVREKIN